MVLKKISMAGLMSLLNKIFFYKVKRAETSEISALFICPQGTLAPFPCILLIRLSELSDSDEAVR